MESKGDLLIQNSNLSKKACFAALQDDASKIITNEKQKIRQRRFLFPFEYSDFRNLLITYGTICLHKRNQYKSFTIDGGNESIIQELYYYASGNSMFNGDLNKGLLLQGKYGCGKTILLKTYSLLQNHMIKKFGLRHPILLFIQTSELQKQILTQTVTNFIRRPMIIDELGHEPKTVLDYGNVIRPISELLRLRSELGTLTHGTSNFDLKTLSSEKFYGNWIGDRLKTMFNFITLPGESRRS